MMTFRTASRIPKSRGFALKSTATFDKRLWKALGWIEARERAEAARPRPYPLASFGSYPSSSLHLTCSVYRRTGDSSALEAVMNSVRNGLGMRETEITREPSRLWNPHSYAVFAQVHNTL